MKSRRPRLTIADEPRLSLLPSQAGRYQVAADRTNSEYVVVDTWYGNAPVVICLPLTPVGYSRAYEAASRLNYQEAA